MSKVSTLNILLKDQLIGTLTHVGHDRSLFAFTEEYTQLPARPVLSLGFKTTFGGLVTDFKPTQSSLLPFFSNLLPEAHLRQYLAQRAGVNPAREFFLLGALGQDLPGAVIAEPAAGEAFPPHDDEILTTQPNPNAPMRFSLAGVQLKFSALESASGGLTIPATGLGGSWIVKLPSSRFQRVPENEFAMMELARAVGIHVPDTQLLPLDKIDHLPQGIAEQPSWLQGQNAFAIKRFDRTDSGQRIHIEDFAQIFRVYPEQKYQKATLRHIAKIIGLESSSQDVAEFVRRLVFNTLIGNADMHLKNWSMIYTDGINASLAPAYDFVSTIAYLRDEHLALKVSRSKKFSDVKRDELSHLAAHAMLPEKLVLDTAKNTVQAFHQVWSREKSHLSLSNDTIQAIDQHIRTLPLAHEK